MKWRPFLEDVKLPQYRCGHKFKKCLARFMILFGLNFIMTSKTAFFDQ